MRDIIVLVALIAGTYLGSVGFAIVMFRLFFPLKKKESPQVRQLTVVYSRNKVATPSKGNVHLASLPGRR